MCRWKRCYHFDSWGILALFTLCGGCLVTETTPVSSQVVVPPGETVERAERLNDSPNAPLIVQTSIGSSFSVGPLGEVAYDGFTLPIVCPTLEKQLIAVQSGTRPSWKALLAEDHVGARASSVAIYEYGSQEEPKLIVEHTDGIILGRAANSEGVLVERPNTNGSRWIGLAPWDGSEIQWLKSDSNVNAFAWINEDSTLVYAQRTPQDTYFELVIREPDGSTWRLEESLPYSWILPVLSPDGEGLYALRMGEGFADLAWGRSKNFDTFKQTLALHRVSDRINLPRAWQVLAASTGGAGLSANELAWFSIELGRLALWNPIDRKINLFPEGTVAACKLGSEKDWLITTREKIERLAILKTTNATSALFEKPWIARYSLKKNTIIVLADEESLEIAELQVDSLNTPREDSEQNPRSPSATPTISPSTSTSLPKASTTESP